MRECRFVVLAMLLSPIAADAQTQSCPICPLYLADSTPPILQLPPNQTAEAVGQSGAVVSFSVSASDNVDDDVWVRCSPEAWSVFPLGTTVVTCTATDHMKNTASGSFTVTVRDTTPPVISGLSDLTLEATSRSGAVATFTGSASDAVSGDVIVTFSPASGSTFPPGITTVTATAIDQAGNIAEPTFSVTVVDPPPAASNLWVTAAQNTSTTIVLRGSDAASASLSFRVVSPPAHGTLSALGPPSCSVTGQGTTSCTATVSYLPTPNYRGSDSFGYTVNDGSVDSPAAAVALTILAVPVVQDVTARVSEGAATVITLSASDVDSPSLNFAIVTPPAHGTLSALADAACATSGGGCSCTSTVRYTPAAGYVGEDSFTFKANDGATESVGKVTLSVLATSAKVTGAGHVAIPGGKASFGFNVTIAAGVVSGSLDYHDQVQQVKLSSASITTLEVSRTTASFAGTCSVQAAADAEGGADSGSPCTFSVTVVDNADPGKGKDQFTISISGQPTGGVLAGGNIKIRIDQP